MTDIKTTYRVYKSATQYSDFSDLKKAIDLYNLLVEEAMSKIRFEKVVEVDVSMTENIKKLERIEVLDIEENTVCGCTKASLGDGVHIPCSSCGHATHSHNFGKGCRVTQIINDQGTYFGLLEKDASYENYRRLKT